MRLLLIANAVGPIGQGIAAGGGLALSTTASELHRRGHSVDILAGEASSYEGAGTLIGISGLYQPTLITPHDHKYTYPIIASSLLANYWRYAYAHQHAYDAIINFCHDWLPLYLTPFMAIPVLHQVNLSDENAVVTEEIQRIASMFPQCIATLSKAQAQALGIAGKSFHTGHGIDMKCYPFSAAPASGNLIWCARISPEKGLEDSAEIARRSGKKLLVCGHMEDSTYFESVMARYKDVIEYLGFLDNASLAKVMGQAEALLCTHKWIEAFGLVVIEALACGTPVITYDRGGPSEIIDDNKTGFIVAADNIEEAVKRVGDLPILQRADCRAECERNFGLEAYGDRIEEWLAQVV